MRATPVSTTYRMPGTVSDVSATLVASTTRRRASRVGEKTRCCSAADSRENSGTTSMPRGPVGFERRQRLGGVADLALAGQEHQDVARTLGRQLPDGVDDRLGLVADDRLALLVRPRQRPSAAGSGSRPGRCDRRPR